MNRRKQRPFFAPLFVATKHICQDRLRSNTTNADLKKRAAFSLLLISQELLDHSFHEHVRARARGALRRRFSQLHVLPGGAAGGGAVDLRRCPSVVATPVACVTRLFAKTGSGQDSQQQWSSCFLFSFFLLLYRMGGIRSC